MSDERARTLERAAIGGDRDAQRELRALWAREGRDLLPDLIRWTWEDEMESRAEGRRLYAWLTGAGEAQHGR